MDERSELFSLDNTSKFLKKNLLLVILVLGGVLMLVVGTLQFFSKSDDSGIEFESVKNEIEAEKIFVDISGAVNETGVYKFSQNEIIRDAIKKAGGLKDDANHEYIDKNVNQAQKLSDGMKLYFPFEDEEISTVLGSSLEVQSAGGLININSASQSQLESLPKIGPVTAEKIIAGRPYNGVEELLIRKVVGSSVFEQIKDLITAP